MTMINEMTTGKGFIMVNKTLAKLVGLVPATIYGELLSTFMYWQQREQLTLIDGKEWFFCTIEDLEDKTTVKKTAQAQAIKVLEKEGLLETKRYGLPAKRYFHITDKFNEIVFADYAEQKTKRNGENDENGSKNSREARPNQIAGKQQTRKPELGNLDCSNSDTNNKHINNKELITKDSLSNELAIDNYQATDDKSSISVSKEKQSTQQEQTATSPVVNADEIKKRIEQQLKADETLTSEDEAIRLLTDAANEQYTAFAFGRWSKKQWTNLITKFVMETIASKRYLNITYGALKGYVYVALKNMADHHDYKNSVEYKEYQQVMANIESNVSPNLPTGIYNWLDKRD